MLGLPRKVTPRVDVVAPMKAYLSSKYSKDEVNRHMDAVNQFQTLRNAVSDIREANDGARVALRRYFEQLNSAAEKFPVSESGVKISFGWTDTLKGGQQNSTISQYSWMYERASVLYNMAAIDTQIAVRMDRSNQANVEAVRGLFTSAAGLLTVVRDQYAAKLVGVLPLDMTVEGLNLYITVLLAQGQSIYYELARGKGMKPETNSKLAAGAADLYRQASRALPAGTGSGPGPRELVEEHFPWATHCNVWAAVFDGASFFQYSEKCFAEAEASGKGYGVRIAWLNAAEAAAKHAITLKTEASTMAKGKSKLAVAAAAAVDVAPAEGLLKAVREKKAEAEQDNRTVYMEVVPKLAELPELARAVLAKATPFAEPTLGAQAAGQVPITGTPTAEELAVDPSLPGPTLARPLFAGIVPAEVAKSLADLDDRLQAITALARDKAQQSSAAARQTLSSLGLPGAVSADVESAGPGLPPAVWDRVHACQRAGGLQEVERLLAANAHACTTVRETLKSATSVLDDEAGRDASCRAQHGARWTSLPSSVVASDLRSDIQKYTRLSDMAGASEDSIRAKVSSHRAMLAGLSRSRSDIDASVPAGAPPGGAAAADPAAEALRQELLGLCEQLEGILNQRTALPSAVVQRFDRVAATQALSAVPAAEHAGVLDRLVSSPNTALQQLETGYAMQEKLLGSIQATFSRYNEVRSLDERTRARQAALQAVTDAVDRFEEIHSNVKEGETFWGELRSRAEALLTRARDMAAARAMQQRELLLNLQGVSPSGMAGPDGFAVGAPGTGPTGAGPHAYGASLAASAGPSAGGAAVPLAVPVSLGPAPGGPGYGVAPGQPMGGYNPFQDVPMGTARSAASSPQSVSTGAVTYLPPGSTMGGFQPHMMQQQGSVGHFGPGPVPVAQPVSYAYGQQPQPSYGYGQPVPTAAPMQYGQPQYGQPQQGGPYSHGPSPASSPAAGPGPVSAPGYGAALAQLTSMGFDRTKADRALAMHGGDFNAALNQLITDPQDRV